MSEEAARPGLFDSLRSLLANVAGLAHARLELAGTELQEALMRLGLVLLALIAALFLAFLGIGFAALAVIMGVGEPHRVAVAAGVGAGFLVFCALIVWWVRRSFLAAPRLFDASLAELRRDRELLISRP